MLWSRGAGPEIYGKECLGGGKDPLDAFRSGFFYLLSTLFFS
jgi:hypothetical protein